MKFLVVLSILLAAVYAYPEFEWGLDNPELSALEGIAKRIANGQVAKPGQFPYQVRLGIIKRKNGKNFSSLCGGALISNKAVLTAAHCLESAVTAILFMGTTKMWVNEPTRVILAVWEEDFVIHEHWNSSSMENDIAIINFPSPIKFNDAVKPVNLPHASQVNLDNRMALISGFGRTGTGSPGSSDLLFAKRKILSADNCMKTFQVLFNTQMHICMDGSQNTSTCLGDSGGPLVIQESDGSQAVVGITSFGGLTCDTGLPVVFTRVTTYLNWIHKHTGIPIRN